MMIRTLNINMLLTINKIQINFIFIYRYKLLGRRNENVRGNKINGISEARQKTTIAFYQL